MHIYIYMYIYIYSYIYSIKPSKHTDKEQVSSHVLYQYPRQSTKRLLDFLMIQDS